VNKIVSPTGKWKIRNDAQGSGDFCALRGSRLHEGLDFECTPGQRVYSPITGLVNRHLRPYAGDGRFKGIEIVDEGQRICKLFYVLPIVPTDAGVLAGQIGGVAQDISIKYGSKMLPHIHCQLIIKPAMRFKDGQKVN